MTTRNRTQAVLTLAAVAMAAVAFTATSTAATLTWSPGDGTWQDSTAGNFGAAWNNANPDSADFTGSANTTYTVTVNGSIDIGNLSFTTTAQLHRGSSANRSIGCHGGNMGR